MSNVVHAGKKAFACVSAFALMSAVTASKAAEQATTKTKPTTTTAAAGWKAPRTADGHPDLQGNWTNATLTNLEREAKYGNNRAMSAADAQAIEKAEQVGIEAAEKPTAPGTVIQDLPTDCGRGFTGVNCGYNSFWIDPGTKVMTIEGEKRTSIIIDPENGRIPPMTAQARDRFAARMTAFRNSGGSGPADGPEMRTLAERCIMSFGSSAGPPMLPLLYNNNYQIVQSRDTILILVEMVHDARIVRMNGTHPPVSVRKWMGDSIGHWEGDTLVVETTNIRREQALRGASDNMKVTERFRRANPMQIVYSFTVDDPETFSKPFSGEVAMNATQDKIYEYACHEGNYALPGILAGAREQETAAAKKAAPTSSK